MKSVFGSFLLAATLVGTAGGCVVRAQGRVSAPPPVAVVEVDEEPPPPRAVVVESRPGFVYTEGHWYRRGGRWEWADGDDERERVGNVWVPVPLGAPQQPARLGRGHVARRWWW